jgi:hypothetical protein
MKDEAQNLESKKARLKGILIGKRLHGNMAIKVMQGVDGLEITT